MLQIASYRYAIVLGKLIRPVLIHAPVLFWNFTKKSPWNGHRSLSQETFYNETIR